MEAVTGQYVDGSLRSALSCAIVTVLPGSSQNLLGHIVAWQGEAFIDAVIDDSVCRRRVFARLRQSNELPAVHQVVHCCVVCINVDSVLRLCVIRAPGTNSRMANFHHVSTSLAHPTTLCHPHNVQASYFPEIPALADRGFEQLRGERNEEAWATPFFWNWDCP